jgi:ADP-heptose:LPS heptosyltransferase
MHVNGVISLAGQLTVLESAWVIKGAKYYVGLDTGMTHIAAALGTKTIAIFSQHNHVGQWEPLSGAAIVVRSPRVACAACGNSRCMVAGHPCMESINVQQVASAIEAMQKQ